MSKILRFATFALILLWLPSQAAAEPTDEVELIQEHLASVEAHLRDRDVSDWPEELQEARERRLDELREYRHAGEFPINTRHPGARVPYFIDDYGTACAVGHLMIESGAEDLAREIVRDENNAWVMEMQTPGLASWVESSGLSAEEAAWIQPTYSFCEGISVAVSGPDEVECGAQITLGTEITNTTDCPTRGVEWGVNETSFPPDAIINDEPQPLDGMNFVSGDEIIVQFDPEQDEDIEFVFTATIQNMGDTASSTHAVRVDCGEPGWTIDEPEPSDTGEKASSDESCSAAGGTATLLPLALFLLGALRRRRV